MKTDVRPAPGRRATPSRRQVAAESRLLDGHVDHASPLRPRAVVIPDAIVAEQFVQYEPCMRGPLTDSAVGDDVLVRPNALALVVSSKLVGALERPVLADGLGPRRRHGARDVA